MWNGCFVSRPIWPPLFYDFYKNIFFRECLKPWFFVTFKIVIIYILPKIFNDNPSLVQEMWKASSLFLTILSYVCIGLVTILEIWRAEEVKLTHSKKRRHSEYPASLELSLFIMNNFTPKYTPYKTAEVAILQIKDSEKILKLHNNTRDRVSFSEIFFQRRNSNDFFA